MDLLRAVIVRTAPKGSAGTGSTGMDLPDLSPPPHATSVKNWVDAIDDGELRHRVSAATGVAPQNYSAQLTANRLAPELAVATSRAAGVGLAGGLVATGLVTEAEAGWPPGAGRPRTRPAQRRRPYRPGRRAPPGDGKALRRQEQDQDRPKESGRTWV